MTSTDNEPSLTSDYAGKDNRSYARGPSDVHLSTLDEEENMAVEHPSGATVSYEIPNNDSSTLTSGPPLASFTRQKPRKSSVVGPMERQLSILDPLSDRVSTILVWKDLTVQARPNKRKEFFARIKSYKDFVPTRKYLLNNTSGAIAGGLWAVMGKSLFFFPSISFSSHYYWQVHRVRANRRF